MSINKKDPVVWSLVTRSVPKSPKKTAQDFHETLVVSIHLHVQPKYFPKNIFMSVSSPSWKT